MTVRADLKEGQALPAYDGFEYLQVRAGCEPAATSSEEFRRLLVREKIIGWLFERWIAPGQAITLSGLVSGQLIEAGIYAAIKFPDGKIQGMGLENNNATGMRGVPASFLLDNEDEWLETIRAYHIASQSGCECHDPLGIDDVDTLHS